VYDWLDLIPVVLGSGVVGTLVCQAGLTIREWMRGQTEVTKIKATADADVVRTWAASEAKIAEMRVAHELGRDRRQLDRPSRRRADLAQLHGERPPPDQLDPPAS
jgi:hypothetical protein